MAALLGERLAVDRRREHLPAGGLLRLNHHPLGVSVARVADLVDLGDDALPQGSEALDGRLRAVVARHHQRGDRDGLDAVLTQVAVGDGRLVVDRVELLGHLVGDLEQLVLAVELLNPAERLAADSQDRVDRTGLERREGGGLVRILHLLPADQRHRVDEIDGDGTAAPESDLALLEVDDGVEVDVSGTDAGADVAAFLAGRRLGDQMNFLGMERHQREDARLDIRLLAGAELQGVSLDDAELRLVAQDVIDVHQGAGRILLVAALPLFEPDFRADVLDLLDQAEVRPGLAAGRDDQRLLGRRRLRQGRSGPEAESRGDEPHDGATHCLVHSPLSLRRC